MCSFGAGTKRIHDSTISGNSADAQSGVFVSGLLQVLNSTIAFNHEVGCFGAVEFLNLAMESSIVARNTCESGPDIDVGGFLDPLWTFTGSHNLIGTSVLPTRSLAIRCSARWRRTAARRARMPSVREAPRSTKATTFLGAHSTSVGRASRACGVRNPISEQSSGNRANRLNGASGRCNAAA